LRAKTKAKARERQAPTTPTSPGQEERGRESLASPNLADFSDEYTGLKLSIKVEGLGEVEGRLLKASRYWLKVITTEGVLYINKAYVISIKPLELAPQKGQ